MRLIVGLGNPGERYAMTPHNLGFLVVDALARALGIEIRRPEADSLVGKMRWGETDLVLAKPQTQMNQSGIALRQMLDRWEVGPRELLVLVDDLDLPWGQIRIRERGRAGTHNGMRSIVEHIGTTHFPRVRMGIRPDPPIEDPAEFVLRPFARREQTAVREFVARGTEATLVILKEGLHSAMNRFNASPAPSDTPVKASVPPKIEIESQRK